MTTCFGRLHEQPQCKKRLSWSHILWNQQSCADTELQLITAKCPLVVQPTQNSLFLCIIWILLLFPSFLLHSYFPRLGQHTIISPFCHCLYSFYCTDCLERLSSYLPSTWAAKQHTAWAFFSLFICEFACFVVQTLIGKRCPFYKWQVWKWIRFQSTSSPCFRTMSVLLVTAHGPLSSM